MAATDFARLEFELNDAWIGEGNSKRITFRRWLKDMADNPRGTLQDAARQLLDQWNAARKPRTRRKPGHCWSCASDLPVRKCKLWLTGMVKPLCASCEKQIPSWPLNRI